MIEHADRPMLEIPTEGLDYVLRVWVGQGQLIPLLAQSRIDAVDRRWSQQDIQKRADHVTFLRLLPEIQGLPVRLVDWLDLIPAQTVSERTVTGTPSGVTDWVATRRDHGWPPRAFSNREKARVGDELLVRTLRWVAAAVLRLRDAVSLPGSRADLPVAAQLDCLGRVLEATEGKPGPEPSKADLLAVRREGGPWRRVAAMARILFELRNPDQLAHALIQPELRPVFFHLGVLGVVLLALRDAGARVENVGILGSSTGRAQFKVTYGATVLDLWFEAGGLWQRYRTASPYRQLTSVLSGNNQSLSPDILLITPANRAFVVECKYSADSDYVGRHGLRQAAFYATELTSSLCRSADAYVVAPEGVARSMARVRTRSGVLGMARPSDLDSLIGDFLEERGHESAATSSNE
ncbi:hypothetical protein [Blastococcus sp. DSM 46786]|uniref:hypothetical protein n=1 Tax=Blastococcus sp. DSM 46786 TaxID=1798227 RepID=UPI0011141564|nr:hypothetical protein [Blastococcus sp. DSM 46786]